MTQHDYIRIARAIRLSWDENQQSHQFAERAVLRELVYELQVTLKKDNPNFNPQKFLMATIREL